MPSFQTYRRALGAALDDLEGPFVLSGGSGTTAVSTRLVNSAASASSGLYDNRWVYVVDGAGAAQVRRVQQGGYAPSTGTLTIYPGWTAPASGDLIEITSLFPATSGSATNVVGHDTDYRSLLNKALRKLLVEDRISVTITGGVDSYSLTTWPWLDRPERLVRVLEPSPVLGRHAVPADDRRPALVRDGESAQLTLDVPFESTLGSMTLEVLRPADTLINGADSSVGLVAEADTARPETEAVVTVALVGAYEALMSRGPGRPSGNWREKWLVQRELARQVRGYDLTAEAPPPAAREEAA